MRGGEQVLDRLARAFGPTDLYTMVHDRSLEHSPAIEACRIHTSILQRWPGGARRFRRWYLPFYPRAIESLRIPDERYDLLISTSSALIKSIRPPRGPDGRAVPHLCYCHTPPRYLWDQVGDYAGRDLKGRLRSTGLSASRMRLRVYDRQTAARVTRFIANSRHTARRIEKAYGREAVVIHPPVDVDFYTPDESGRTREDFYLVVSALEPYKRVDLAVEAAERAGRRLVIAGGGSNEAVLRQRARTSMNIEFLGPQPPNVLRDLYRRARALLFPGREDFGIVPIEAMACGCPVIAYAYGGAEDWMRDRCGVTFTLQNAEALGEVIRAFEADPAIDPHRCRANAARFHPDRFDAEFSEVLDQVLDGVREPTAR